MPSTCSYCLSLFLNCLIKYPYKMFGNEWLLQKNKNLMDDWTEFHIESKSVTDCIAKLFVLYF